MSHSNEDKKLAIGMNQCATVILMLCYLATFILIIIWLFKLYNNAKNEPKVRINYITEDPSTFYTEDEFCYENCELFVIRGALKIFGLPFEKIKKFSKAVLITIFISLGSTIFIIIFGALEKKCNKGKDLFMCFGCVFGFCFVVCVLLSIIFAIVLMHYYFKGNYTDFEEFSRCRYLSKQFRKDYEFIFKIKNEYKLPFVVIVITEFFNFIKLVAEFGEKEESNNN